MPQVTSAFDVIIDKTFTATTGGAQRELSVNEALQQRIYQDALAGINPAIRTVMGWLLKREAALVAKQWNRHSIAVLHESLDPRNVDDALILLNIATEQPRPAEAVTDRRLLLDPWATELALSRRGMSAPTREDLEEARRYDAVLGQIVTVRENGQQRRLPADQAFPLHLTNRGLSGDGSAGRVTLTALEQARGTGRVDQQGPTSITIVPVTPGNVTPALRALRMAQLLDRFRPTAKLKLEPWIVEAALERLGERQLSPNDRAVIVAATRTPNKVRWPEWWTAA